MSSYLTEFSTLADYNIAKAGRAFSVPNVSRIQSNGEIKYLKSHIPDTIGVRGANGICYALQEYLNLPAAEKPVAVGAYIFDSTTGKGIVVHATVNTSVQWSNNTSVEIPGIVTTTDAATAAQDFAGAENTAAALSYAASGLTPGIIVPVFTWAYNLSWAEIGLTGYIPARGELGLIKTNLVDVNTVRTALGQDEITMDGNNFWCSTQLSSSYAWTWNGSRWYGSHKSSNLRAVAVAAF